MLVWPAGRTPWCPCGLQGRSVGLPCACEIYYVLFAFYSLVVEKTAVYEDKDGNFVLILVFYSLADAKAAVHEDKDDKFVLISATVLVMKPALQTWHA